jgi:anionic cell wall polymer biosynthesis LytR-Cps2A-Psr (LCP) family protein
MARRKDRAVRRDPLYARQRELIPDGDYGRQRHQQQFIKALIKRVVSAGTVTSPVKLDRVVRAAGKALTVDTGSVALDDWIFNLKSVDPNGLVMIKTNGGRFNSKVVGGQSYEVLDDTSRQLFRAMNADRAADFIASHPDWVSRDG